MGLALWGDAYGSSHLYAGPAAATRARNDIGTPGSEDLAFHGPGHHSRAGIALCVDSEEIPQVYPFPADDRAVAEHTVVFITSAKTAADVNHGVSQLVVWSYEADE